jgi:hypothetical protein
MKYKFKWAITCLHRSTALGKDRLAKFTEEEISKQKDK